MRKYLLLLLPSLTINILHTSFFNKTLAMEYDPNWTSELVDEDGNKIYKAGGVYLGDDLSDTSVSIRYWDDYYVYEDWYYINSYFNKELLALISSTHPSANISSVCVTTGIMGVLKGIEVYKNYETSPYPLFGSQIGRYIHTKNNFEVWQNASSIVLSGEYYKNDTRYPLAVLSDSYNKVSYVYNELIPIAYYVDIYGASYDDIVTSISNYFISAKSSDNYRYRLVNTNDCYTKLSDTEPHLAYNEIRQAIIDGYPVLIGDDDFDFVTNSSQSQNPGGHVMVAVGTGVAQIYDYTNRKWITVEEIIYDQGAGKYAAMPIYDVYDYFILDVRLQKKERYGLGNWFTRWVDF